MAEPLILLVEDDPLIVRLYQTAFEHAGFRVEIAFDGEAALAKLGSLDPKPTLILSDIMMPHMNGLELLEKLKAEPLLKSIPVVLLTNLAGGTDAARGLELGAVTYLVKSEYAPREIVGKLKEIVAGYTRNQVPMVGVQVKDIPPGRPA